MSDGSTLALNQSSWGLMHWSSGIRVHQSARGKQKRKCQCIIDVQRLRETDRSALSGGPDLSFPGLGTVWVFIENARGKFGLGPGYIEVWENADRSKGYMLIGVRGILSASYIIQVARMPRLIQWKSGFSDIFEVFWTIFEYLGIS